MVSLILVFILFHYLLLLLGVSYLTLYERHLLGLSQLRLGPNKPFFMGLVLPLLDGLKLFRKGFFFPYYSSPFYFVLGPLFMFFLLFIYWAIIPYSFSILSISNSGLYFLVLLGSVVYSLFILGYFSKSKYAYLGAMRSTSQRISFEVSFFFLVFSYMVFHKFLSFTISGLVFFLPLTLLWFLFMLVELGRAPFDFPEAERELVSGYSLEYAGVLFVFVFLREYGFILFFCSLYSQLFLSWLGTPVFSFYLVLTFCIFLRSCLPRYRYDILIRFFWKVLLPFSMLLMGDYVLFYYRT